MRSERPIREDSLDEELDQADTVGPDNGDVGQVLRVMILETLLADRLSRAVQCLRS